MEKENGFADTNAAELNKNVANYAPGVQDTNLTNAQGSRAATMTGNMTPDAGADVPYTADAPAPVRSELAKRIMAAHDGAVSRAGLTAKVGGYGDTWFNNGLNTSAADRNIDTTNNYANGTKSILGAQQDAAAAAAYKPPSVWGPVLSGISSVAAGAAGGGGGGGFKINVPGFNPIAGASGQ